jgi:transcription antitermination factor NusG
MSALWYALRSKPNKEEALWQEVLAQGLEGFYPQIHVHPVNPRSRKVRSYFPGYMFVQADLAEVGYSALAWMPHSNGLVSFGDEPATVPDTLILAIRRRVEQINAAGGELFEGLKKGDSVTVQEGPFAGYEAIFDARVSGTERVRVLLKLLKGQQMPLVLPPGQIKRNPEDAGRKLPSPGPRRKKKR